MKPVRLVHIIKYGHRLSRGPFLCNAHYKNDGLLNNTMENPLYLESGEKLCEACLEVLGPIRILAEMDL